MSHLKFFFLESSTSFAFYGNLTFKSLHLTIVAYHAFINKLAQRRRRRQWQRAVFVLSGFQIQHI